MRMMILALAVLLLAAPALATVTIEATQVGETKVVEISYDAETETELVRAFALDITVTDGNIVEINDFAIGDDNGGYGIFPGNFSRYITVNSTTGDVDDWDVPEYTPVADGADPGAQGGLGTPGITIEMGALYETNAPLKSGVLCTITVSDDCTVNLALNGMRGNVVLETAEEPLDPVELVGCEVVTAPDECFDSSHPKYDEWVNVGKPESWCYKYQCYGDADGKRNGSMIVGYARVRVEDLNILVAGWKVEDYVDPETHPWIAADFDRKLNGSVIVGLSRIRVEDLNILVANWKSDTGIDMANPGCGGDIDLTTP